MSPRKHWHWVMVPSPTEDWKRSLAAETLISFRRILLSVYGIFTVFSWYPLSQVLILSTLGAEIS
jgi:hypothetical protein